MSLDFFIKNQLARNQAPQRNFHIVVATASASRSLTVLESGATCTNLGNSGSATFQLPDTRGIAGVVFAFKLQVAQALIVDPGAYGAFYTSSKGTDDVTLTADAIGEWMIVESDGQGDWICQTSGTWS